MIAWPAVTVVLYNDRVEVYEYGELTKTKSLPDIFGYYFHAGKLIIKYSQKPDPEGGTMHLIYTINHVNCLDDQSSIKSKAATLELRFSEKLFHAMAQLTNRTTNEGH